MNAFDVGVILINWNNASDTIACIDSLKAGTLIPRCILVWDNGSHDGSAERIRKQHPDIELAGAIENIGFAAANNRAAQMLLKKGMDAVWILNNDTTVDRRCLESLAEALRRHDDAGAVSGKIQYPKPANTLWYAGGDVRPFSAAVVHRGKGETDAGQYNQESPVAFLSGCCMLVRAAAVKRTSLFDPAYFAYYEDADLSLRMQAVGFKLYYVPKAVLYHHVSGSIAQNSVFRGRISPLQHYLQTRNRLYLLRRHAKPTALRAVALAWLVARTLPIAVLHIACGHLEKGWQIIRGVLHGMTGTMRSFAGGG